MLTRITSPLRRMTTSVGPGRTDNRVLVGALRQTEAETLGPGELLGRPFDDVVAAEQARGVVGPPLTDAQALGFDAERHGGQVDGDAHDEDENR